MTEETEDRLLEYYFALEFLPMSADGREFPERSLESLALEFERLQALIKAMDFYTTVSFGGDETYEQLEIVGRTLSIASDLANKVSSLISAIRRTDPISDDEMLKRFVALDRKLRAQCRFAAVASKHVTVEEIEDIGDD